MKKYTCAECLIKMHGYQMAGCSNCGKIVCEKHAHLKYIDESNISITKNSPIICSECYKLLNS